MQQCDWLPAQQRKDAALSATAALSNVQRLSQSSLPQTSDLGLPNQDILTLSACQLKVNPNSEAVSANSSSSIAAEPSAWKPWSVTRMQIRH
jgi:hypothetical protein